MKRETPICGRCGEKSQEQESDNPTWFGKYHFDILVDAICIGCWKNGERWDNKEKKEKKVKQMASVA